MKVVDNSTTNHMFGSLRRGDRFTVENGTDVYFVLTSELDIIRGAKKEAINEQDGKCVTFQHDQTVNLISRLCDCRFDALKPGDVFAVDEGANIYMVILPLCNAINIELNAVNLRSGRSVHVPSNQNVYRVECELNIHDCKIVL